MTLNLGITLALVSLLRPFEIRCESNVTSLTSDNNNTSSQSKILFQQETFIRHPINESVIALNESSSLRDCVKLSMAKNFSASVCLKRFFTNIFYDQAPSNSSDGRGSTNRSYNSNKVPKEVAWFLGSTMIIITFYSCIVLWIKRSPGHRFRSSALQQSWMTMCQIQSIPPPHQCKPDEPKLDDIPSYEQAISSSYGHRKPQTFANDDNAVDEEPPPTFEEALESQRDVQTQSTTTSV